MVKFERLNWDVNKVWLTSDTHYHHRNICRGVSDWSSGYRDFNNLQEMDDTIVKGINDYVGEYDMLIHHGDWSLGGEDKIDELRNRIKCRNVILIRGNHDLHVDKHRGRFLMITDVAYFRVDDIRFVSFHYPIAHWADSNKGVFHFYGHVHGEFNNGGRSMDVGIDNVHKLSSEYAPVNLENAVLLMEDNAELKRHHNRSNN